MMTGILKINEHASLLFPELCLLFSADKLL